MADTLKDPAIVHLVIVQGSLFEQRFAWVRDGVRVSLDGYAAQAEIRTEVNGRLIANLTPHLTVDALTDEVALVIPATVTAKIDRDGVWDLFLVPADPVNTVKLIEGRVKSKLRVTQQ